MDSWIAMRSFAAMIETHISSVQQGSHSLWGSEQAGPGALMIASTDADAGSRE
jgi:hypothetical protein